MPQRRLPRPVDVDALKRAAALAACAEAKSGMVLGLGTGSTIQYALEELARRKTAGEDLRGVPTSRRTEDECRRLGLPTVSLRDHPVLDLTLDGADELDDRLNLIKGGGGALLREKVVAAASKTMVVVADESKFVNALGSTFAVPVEVVPFAEATVRRRLAGMGANLVLRQKNGRDYETDNGNLVLDARFSSIPDPARLERDVKMLPGVAEVGLFVGLAHRAYVAGTGGVRKLEPGRRMAPPTERL